MVPSLNTREVLPPSSVVDEVTRILWRIFTLRDARWRSAAMAALGFASRGRRRVLPERIVISWGLYWYAISPAVSMPAGPPPAIRIFCAKGSRLCKSSNAASESL